MTKAIGTLTALVSAICITGCATYQAAPLIPHRTDSAVSDLARIRIDPATMPLPSLARHRFDPSDGLDIEEIAMLAMANNPDLKLARDDLGIARAQAFSTGLLPDPQLQIDSAYPGIAGGTRAFTYGLGIDVMAILSRASNLKSAQATVTKTDLGLLWQEWQVVAQAKTLFIRSRYQQETLPLLREQYDLSEQRYRKMSEALASGAITEDQNTAALIAYTDAKKLYTEAQRTAEQTHHDLNLLLGLAPDVHLDLVEQTPDTSHRGALDAILPEASAKTEAESFDQNVSVALQDLPRRRPDLIALQAGYESQDQKYRNAILNQFPALTVGFNRQRDTSNIYATGFSINLTLPVFNRNRGNIMIEKSTRQRLRDEYQNRLNLAYADVDHLRNDIDILRHQLTDAQRALPHAQLAADHARQAYEAHDLTLTAYTDAQAAASTKALDLATLREALAEQQVGLQALLGSAIPDAYFSDTPSLRPHAD